ncbi:hypothetical protein [Bradyrhizobium sp. STM 3557]|uniref:hypothetical protein n=1 Tax=Bradyrhizobium sp. STM 3557 TaxID=578920 RepID=UPI0038910FB3
MTISSATSTSGYSPLDMLKQELAREVSAGNVASSDQSALSSALDDIDSALKSSAGSSSPSASAAPQDMKSKIDDLIQSEVSSGKLTSDQATELKSVFANAFSGHAPGAGGPPPSASGTDDASSDDSSTSSSSSTATDTTELLRELLAALQKSITQSASSYGANGTTSSSATGTSLVLNYTT